MKITSVQSNKTIIKNVDFKTSNYFVTFKGNINDEWVSERGQKATLETSVESAGKRRRRLKAKFAKDLKDKDIEIQGKKDDYKKLVGKCEDLENTRIKNQGKKSKLARQNEIRQSNLEEGQKKVQELQDQQKTIMEEIKLVPQRTQEKLNTRITEMEFTAENSLNTEINKILSTTKNQLTRDCINRFKAQIEIPSGILIESQNECVSKDIFKWVVKRTESNCATVNAEEIKDKTKLIEIIDKISKRSKNDFDVSGRSTITYIENFDCCGIRTPESRTMLELLKTRLDCCSETSHNTLFISTTDISKLDPIATSSHRFPVRVKTDEFLLDEEMGYKSILKELESLKITGKDLSNIDILGKTLKIVNKITKLVNLDSKSKKNINPDIDCDKFKTTLNKKVNKLLEQRRIAAQKYQEVKGAYICYRVGTKKIIKALKRQAAVESNIQKMEKILKSMDSQTAVGLIRRLSRI